MEICESGVWEAAQLDTHNHKAGEEYLSWGIAVLISNEFVCIHAVTKKVYFLLPEFVKI